VEVVSSQGQDILSADNVLSMKMANATLNVSFNADPAQNIDQ